jgi:tetratricopeptide (TPR) repeat protein
MPPSERQRFLKDIVLDGTLFYKTLSTIDTSKSQCFKSSDRKAIFDAIRRSIGFTKMDSVVLRALEGWLVQQLRQQIVATVDSSVEQAQFQSALGLLFSEMGRHKEAMGMMEACLEARKRVLGDDHPDTLDSMNNLALTYVELGRHEEAMGLEEACLEAQKRVLGDDHSDTLDSMNNLALTYGELGRHEEAMGLQEACLEAHKRVLGDYHSDTLHSMNNLACTYGKLGRHKEARGLKEACLEAYKRVYGEDHPCTLSSCLVLVQFLFLTLHTYTFCHRRERE